MSVQCTRLFFSPYQYPRRPCQAWKQGNQYLLHPASDRVSLCVDSRQPHPAQIPPENTYKYAKPSPAKPSLSKSINSFACSTTPTISTTMSMPFQNVTFESLFARSRPTSRKSTMQSQKSHEAPSFLVSSPQAANNSFHQSSEYAGFKLGSSHA
uniref:Ovule protein n=1 Tax=Panagrellus redivivus TaxID=6233 RepID=A0A7E4UTY1_PANRE